MPPRWRLPPPTPQRRPYAAACASLGRMRTSWRRCWARTPRPYADGLGNRGCWGGNAEGEAVRASMLCAALAAAGRMDGATPADEARALAAAMPSAPPKDEAGDDARRRLSAAVAARCRTMPLESLAALAEVAKQLDAPRADIW